MNDLSCPPSAAPAIDIPNLASQMEMGSIGVGPAEKIIEENKSLGNGVTNLIHWLQNPYLSEESKDFVCRIISVGARENCLPKVESWLRTTYVGSSSL
jgi:hypothetical protein